jgi:NADPH-dependent curcumin reductase
MSDRINRRWLLAQRPQGMVTPLDFRWVEEPARGPSDGEVLVRNLYLSCDPTQRGWMGGDTYMPGVHVGEVMRSFAAGQILESRHPHYATGQLVQGLLGWQDYALVKPETARLAELPAGVSIETALSALGLTGLTAYFGLLEVGRPEPGETVVVSGAAGATGSVVGQIAKIKGCRAVGIAGGGEKCRYLRDELGFDAAIDYKSEDVAARLKEACPRGIDVFFDNVGGEILEIALSRLALRARVVICGAISRYNDTTLAPGPRNYMNLLVQRARMEGFLVLDYEARAQEAVSALSTWIKQGKLKDRADVVLGLENAPVALARLFKGENQGKQLVKIAEPNAE